jgi:hypothetical protein
VNYPKEKVKSMQTAVKRKLELIVGEPLEDVESSNEPDDSHEIIDQLKEQFSSCRKRSEKILVLSVLPRSWTTKKIAEEFESTNYLARQVKKLVAEKGILSTPNQKAGRTLSTTIVDDVRAFYRGEMIS